MCLGIPGQVVAIPPDGSHLARVDVAGVSRLVNVGLVEPDGVKEGDWVLIHVGFAMSIIDEDDARSSLALLKDMGQAWVDEVSSVRESSIE